MTLHNLAALPPSVGCKTADLAHYKRTSPVDIKRLVCERAQAAFCEAEALLEMLKCLWLQSDGWKHPNNQALWRECAAHVDEHMELPVIVQIKLLGCTIEKLALNGGIVP